MKAILTIGATAAALALAACSGSNSAENATNAEAGLTNDALANDAFVAAPDNLTVTDEPGAGNAALDDAAALNNTGLNATVTNGQ